MADFAEFREAMEKDMREFRAQMERDTNWARYSVPIRTERTIKSNQFLSNAFDEQKNDLIALQKDNKELKEANKKLLSEYEVLKKQISLHKQRIMASELYSRNPSVEIKGILISEEESIPDTLHWIGELVYVPIDESEVEGCHREPTKNADAPPPFPNILAQFKSRAIRNAVLEKAKKTRI